MKELNNWKLLFRISSYSTAIEFNFPQMGTDDGYTTARYKWPTRRKIGYFSSPSFSNLSIDVIRR